MAVAWHCVNPHARSGDMVGTQGTGTQQGPNDHPDGGERDPGREGNAPTAACLAEPGLPRCPGSGLSPLLAGGTGVPCSPASPAWPWLPYPPTAPRGSGTSPSSAGPGILQPHAPCCGVQEPARMAPLPSAALCSPVTMLSHLLINQADCNVFLGH